MIVALVSTAGGSRARLSFDVSTDAGATWSMRSAPAAVFGATGPWPAGAADAAHWQIAFGSKLWTTGDAGRTWRQVADFAGFSAITDVHFVTPETGFVSATG